MDRAKGASVGCVSMTGWSITASDAPSPSRMLSHRFSKSSHELGESEKTCGGGD